MKCGFNCGKEIYWDRNRKERLKWVEENGTLHNCYEVTYHGGDMDTDMKDTSKFEGDKKND